MYKCAFLLGGLPGFIEEEFRLHHLVVACDRKAFITSLTNSEFLATNEIKIPTTEAYSITCDRSKKEARCLIWSYAGLIILL